MNEVYLIGGGTLARFIMDVMERHGGWKTSGIFDDMLEVGIKRHGAPVLGPIEAIAEKQYKTVMIAVGNPKFRRAMMERFPDKSYQPLVDPTAIISRGVIINKGTIIGPNCTILAESEIGKGACLLAQVNVNQNVRVGDYSLIGAGAIIGNDAVIGEGSHIGLGARIKLGQITDPWSDFNG